MHAFRLRRKNTVLAVTALAAALALTACQPGEDTSGADKPAATSQATSKGDTSGGTSGDSSSGASGGASGSASGGSSKDEAPGTVAGGDGATEGDPCSGDNSEVTVQKVERPLNHMVLKITNNSSERCDAFSAPALRFDDAQAPTRILEESQPQSVVGVEPGASAYAAIGLSSPEDNGDGNGIKPVTELQVHFMGKDDHGSVGSPVDLTLPEGTHIDDSAFVTYWLSDLQDALTY